MPDTIFDIDFDKFALQTLPPDKRYTNTTAWQRLLLKPAQYLRDIFLGDYRTGSAANLWVDSTTYGKYDQVKYKAAIYESIIADNLAITPTDQTAWRLILPSFIGMEERLKYNGNKLIFEWAINKNFDTVFRQPPNTSDIFISVFANPFNVFVIGAAESNSSVNYADTSAQFIINEYDFDSYFNMAINVPVAVFNALDADTANCEKIIRNFANRYIVAGITYQIITY
jgi:hypothetical protein